MRLDPIWGWTYQQTAPPRQTNPSNAFVRSPQPPPPHTYLRPIVCLFIIPSVALSLFLSLALSCSHSLSHTLHISLVVGRKTKKQRENHGCPCNSSHHWLTDRPWISLGLIGRNCSTIVHFPCNLWPIEGLGTMKNSQRPAKRSVMWKGWNIVPSIPKHVRISSGWFSRTSGREKNKLFE